MNSASPLFVYSRSLVSWLWPKSFDLIPSIAIPHHRRYGFPPQMAVYIPPSAAVKNPFFPVKPPDFCCNRQKGSAAALIQCKCCASSLRGLRGLCLLRPLPRAHPILALEWRVAAFFALAQHCFFLFIRSSCHAGIRSGPLDERFLPLTPICPVRAAQSKSKINFFRIPSRRWHAGNNAGGKNVNTEHHPGKTVNRMES